jgi:hypothetical protein
MLPHSKVAGAGNFYGTENGLFMGLGALSRPKKKKAGEGISRFQDAVVNAT